MPDVISTRQLRKLRLLGYTVMPEHSDMSTHIQVYNSKTKQYIYLDIENNQFKAWRLDINGHAPVMLSSMIARTVVDILDSFRK